MKIPEEYRFQPANKAYHSNPGEMQGMFKIPMRVKIYPYKTIVGYYVCMVSSGMGWEHVSITLRKPDFSLPMDRCPTWEEMCYIKDLFWEKHELAVQYHPPESEHVNMHPYCLHLWRPTHQELVYPPSIMVGIKKVVGIHKA